MAMETYSGRKGKKCVLYLRVSLERQTEGFSLEGQEHSLKEWAKFEGMSVVETYIEAGRSGKSISGRETFQRMLNDIATGKVVTDYVLVFKMSRFGRNAKDVLVSLAFLQSYGVNLICQQDGIDSSTQMGKMMLTILGAVAEMERENILAQTMLGRQQKAREGGWNGGYAPYGYMLVNGKLEINEDEARIVKLIFDKFVNEGMGYSPIAAFLNRQGIQRPPAPTGISSFTDWNVNHIKYIVSSPIYAGRIVFGKTRQQRIEGTENEYKRVRSDNVIISDTIAHEPIVSEELFQQAQVKQQAKQATGRPSYGRGPKHLLAGLLKCPQCGGSMCAKLNRWKKPDGTKGEHLYYQCEHNSKAKCGQCSQTSIRGDWVETEVIEYTRLLIQNPKFAEDIQAQIGQKVDSSEIEAEIEGYRNTLKKLERNKASLEHDIDSIADEDRNAERKRRDMNNRLNGLYDEIYDIEAQIENCEQRKQAVEQQNLTVENVYSALQQFEQFFDKMELSEQREVLASLISEVHLHPKDTWKEGKNPVKKIIYAFPMAMEDPEEFCADLCCPSSPTTLPSVPTASSPSRAAL